MTGRSILWRTCAQPVVIRAYCPKIKIHPLCGWIFIMVALRVTNPPVALGDDKYKNFKNLRKFDDFKSSYK